MVFFLVGGWVFTGRGDRDRRIRPAVYPPCGGVAFLGRPWVLGAVSTGALSPHGFNRVYANAVTLIVVYRWLNLSSVRLLS